MGKTSPGLIVAEIQFQQVGESSHLGGDAARKGIVDQEQLRQERNVTNLGRNIPVEIGTPETESGEVCQETHLTRECPRESLQHGQSEVRTGCQCEQFGGKGTDETGVGSEITPRQCRGETSQFRRYGTRQGIGCHVQGLQFGQESVFGGNRPTHVTIPQDELLQTIGQEDQFSWEGPV